MLKRIPVKKEQEAHTAAETRRGGDACNKHKSRRKKEKNLKEMEKAQNKSER